MLRLSIYDHKNMHKVLLLQGYYECTPIFVKKFSEYNGILNAFLSQTWYFRSLAFTNNSFNNGECVFRNIFNICCPVYISESRAEHLLFYDPPTSAISCVSDCS